MSRDVVVVVFCAYETWLNDYLPKESVLPGNCLSVCLSVNRVTQKDVGIWWNFGWARYVTSKNWLDFGDDPADVTLESCLELYLHWRRIAFSDLLFTNVSGS